MNSNSKGEKGAADCGSFFLKSEKNLTPVENQIEFRIKLFIPDSRRNEKPQEESSPLNH